MSDIDEPGIRWELFTRLNTELQTFRSDIATEGKILCPVCGRPFPFESFSLEHIIPQRVLKHDPQTAQRFSKNQRAGLTLLCKKNLVAENGKQLNFGCNQWKGKAYDKGLESHFLGTRPVKGMVESFFSMAYLALFSRYGYKVAFTQAGNLCRKQFLNPNLRLMHSLPVSSRMVLGFERGVWEG